MDTRLKQQEELLGTTDNKKSGEIVSYEKLENTPFTLVEVETGVFGAIGLNRVTEIRDTKEEVRDELMEITWDRITQVIWIIAEKINKVKNVENGK